MRITTALQNPPPQTMNYNDLMESPPTARRISFPIPVSASNPNSTTVTTARVCPPAVTNNAGNYVVKSLSSPSASQQWICDVCKACVFSNYEEAAKHEVVCRAAQRLRFLGGSSSSNGRILNSNSNSGVGGSEPYSNSVRSKARSNIQIRIGHPPTLSNENRLLGKRKSSDLDGFEQRYPKTAIVQDDANAAMHALSHVFVKDSMNRWSCKHCSAVPYKFRAPGAVYGPSKNGGEDKNDTPPPLEFIERHLEECCGDQFYIPSASRESRNASGGNSQRIENESASLSLPYDRSVLYSSSCSPNAVTQYGGTTLVAGASVGQPVMTTSYSSFPLTAQSQSHSYFNPSAADMPASAVPLNSGAYHLSRQGNLSPPELNARTNVGPTQNYSVMGQDTFNVPANEPLPEDSLVLDEDKAILTDYFYYLLTQFKPCVFLESDRSAKGRKRDNIPLGFRGIHCRHCSAAVENGESSGSNGRKFFWSNVDRLANSFTEIPNHLMKCRKVPSSVRDHLTRLKKTHTHQMATIPRGSQKVCININSNR